MADGTGIEWTHRAGTKGETWNPIVGCSIATAGCTNCYAMRTAARIEAIDAAAGRVGHYAGTTKKVKGRPVWTGKIGVAPDHIFTAPLRWRSPRTVFVNSMSDLFHEDVPDAVIDRVFAVMALSPQHTFQVLTKRAARMREYVSGLPERRANLGCDSRLDWCEWPLSNVWLGVSAERQQEADERVPDLLATPAAIRFVSAEPLLGPIDLTAVRMGSGCDEEGVPLRFDTLRPTTPIRCGIAGDVGRAIDRWAAEVPKLDWVIVGGESGNGARPMHPDWARSIRDQCAASGTAFFLKQWGAWKPGFYSRSRHTIKFDPSNGERFGMTLGAPPHANVHEFGDGYIAVRVGKKRAGRLLDGVEHNGFPEMREVPFG